MRNHSGVTIVELCVVVAVIAALLALLLPAVQSARERARETVCQNNVHQLNLATAQYAEAHKQLPGSNPPDRVGGWMVSILPFLEQQILAGSVTLGMPTSDTPASLFQPPAIFRCPRRNALDGAPIGAVQPGHYVFVPASGRKSFLLFDAPVDMNVPWVSGPEMSYDAVVRAKGPHHGGFYFGRGFQQGVDLMIDGQVMQ
jgi:type II secretory pathway pseudopilin PulG